MASTPPLWTGRERTDDHGWLAEPTVGPRPRPVPAPPPPEPPRRRPWLWALAGAAIVAILAVAVFAGTLIDGGRAPSDSPVTVAAGNVPATQITKVYNAAARGVVSVQVAEGGATASGTGFVIDGDGTIVTNDHVVSGARRAQVRFTDHGEFVPADVVGTDPSSDLAVLRVDLARAPRLHPLALADSDKVRVGDVAIAIGYPLGLDRTATAGIISGLGREIEAPNGFKIEKVIQTDAPINPGNSGGPLLDARARVVGVNSQIATAGSRGNVGIGFAVPANTVRSVVPRLKAGKAIVRPFLGVSTGAALARAGLKATQAPNGRGGDVIVGIDGQQVSAPDDVSRAIDGRKPGESVRVVVDRDGKQRTVTIVLGRRPNGP